jgi:beta-N-acetylhexosaminidase
MPASLAPELLTGILRERLGFEGLIVTDNTAMTGFTSVMPRAEALPRAVVAGNDMLLGNVDVETDFAILLDAVGDGRIPPKRLDEAVRRVLALKASIGLHVETDRSQRELPDVAEESQWRASIAENATTVVKNRGGLIPLTPRPGLRALVYVLGDAATFYDPTPPLSAYFIAGLRERGLDVEIRRVPGNTTTIPEAELLHEHFDVCLYYADVRFVGNSNVLRLAWTPAQGPDAPRHVATLPTVLVSIADPYLLQDVPMIQAAINGYTPSTATVDAALAVLFGEREAVGVSPVDPFAGHWDAAL